MNSDDILRVQCCLISLLSMNIIATMIYIKYDILAYKGRSFKVLIKKILMIFIYLFVGCFLIMNRDIKINQ
jgi:hypothetical protein